VRSPQLTAFCQATAHVAASDLLGTSARSHALLPVAITLHRRNRDSDHSITLISRSRDRLAGGAETSGLAPRRCTCATSAVLLVCCIRCRQLSAASEPASIQTELPFISVSRRVHLRSHDCALAMRACCPFLENLAFLFFDEDVPVQGDLRRETWGRHCSCGPH